MSFATVPLKHLCREPVAYGANIASDNYVPNGVRFLRTTDITEMGRLISADQGVYVDPRDAAEAFLRDGDILMSRSGTIGRSLVYKGRDHGPCAHAGYLVRFRPKADVDPRWIFYFTKSTLFAEQVAEDVVESTISNFNGQKFAGMSVPAPLYETQRLIADFLDRKTAAIDELIANKERLVALLAEKRQALITQGVIGGFVSTGATKDSGLPWIGRIPEHWNIQRLRYISPRISGRLVFKPAQYFVDEGVPFLMGNNITEDGIAWTNLKYVSEETNASFANHALRSGDVVMVRVGAPGVTCVVPPQADGLNCGSMMIIRRAPTFSSSWLAFMMNSSIIKTQIDLVQYGAAQEQINISDGVNFVVPVPLRLEPRSQAVHDRSAARLAHRSVLGGPRSAE